MGTLTITTRFPLGVYQGHGPDGTSPDDYPSTARLHSALMQAAGKGALAEERDGDLRPTKASLKALRWLEENPPVKWQPARTVPFGRFRETASYRADGVLNGNSKGLTERKARKRISRAVAVDSAWGWQWEAVPEEVLGVLEALCADVSCLGETDSPVLLDTQVKLGQPLVRVERGQLAGRGISVRTPAPGRVQALEDAYETANPRRRPSLAADRASGSQLPSPSAVPREGLTNAYYDAEKTPESLAPWGRAIVFELSREVAASDRVGWAVALHRTIAYRLGDDAPSIITGKYAKGVAQPPNRVAIQYLPQNLPAQTGLVGPRIAVLLPRGMAAPDEIRLRHALAGSIRLYLGGGGEIRLGGATDIPLTSFWQLPGTGLVRLWAPSPALVPETRRQTTSEGRWSLEHAALLSVGFVFREQLGSLPPGQKRYLELVERVRACGVRIVQARLIPDSRVERYSHKMPAGVPCTPYSALIDLGSLSDDATLLAMGQSRHVGGGLLLPCDLPGDLMEGWV